MSKPSQVILVLEDEHQEMLVYRHLKRLALRTRIRRSPTGEGSAENWVRKTFVEEVSAYRTRQSRASTALIVVIDADVHTVQDRLAQLDRALRNAGKEVVDPKTERIARLVSKRNIETWILSLNAERVNEETDYTTRENHWNRLIPQASVTLFEWTRPNAVLPEFCTPSLRSGIAELDRLRV